MKLWTSGSGLTRFSFIVFFINPILANVLPEGKAEAPTDSSDGTKPDMNKKHRQAPAFWKFWGPDATYVAGDEAWAYDPNFSTEAPGTARFGSDFTYPVGVEVFSHLADRNFIIRKVTQAIVTYFARNFAWTGILAAVGAAERTWPEIKAYTQLDEEDHGQGAEATHALAEVVTTIGHVGFEMLFWGLAGFVNPEDYVADEKAGLSADALAGAAGVDEHDEFFKDNAIESGGTTMFWLLMGFFYLVNNLT